MIKAEKADDWHFLFSFQKGLNLKLSFSWTLKHNQWFFPGTLRQIRDLTWLFECNKLINWCSIEKSWNPYSMTTETTSLPIFTAQSEIDIETAPLFDTPHFTYVNFFYVSTRICVN